MGIETVAIAGFAALQAANTLKEGDQQAKGIVKAAEYQASNSADNTLRGAGKLQTSFLQSGLTLEGGPMDVLTQAFGQGRTDINRLASNANNASKNAVNAARSKAIAGLMTAAGSASMGSSMFDAAGDAATTAASYAPDSFAYGLSDMGFNSTATTILEKSDMRAGIY